MTAFNFQPQFVPLIKSGEKRSTIRQTKRCKVGDSMQLYTGQRTRTCKKIMDVECIGTAKIVINRHSIWRICKKEGIVCVNKMFLHEQEGFINAQQFLDFFKDKYGLPFIGYIHTWGKS